MGFEVGARRVMGRSARGRHAPPPTATRRHVSGKKSLPLENARGSSPGPRAEVNARDSPLVFLTDESGTCVSLRHSRELVLPNEDFRLGRVVWWNRDVFTIASSPRPLLPREEREIARRPVVKFKLLRSTSYRASVLFTLVRCLSQSKSVAGKAGIGSIRVPRTGGVVAGTVQWWYSICPSAKDKLHPAL